MSNEKSFTSLKGRIAFVQSDVELLAKNKGKSFADDIIFNSLDSHLSDLLAEERATYNSHPLRDFLELRMRGHLVDFGSIPLGILSVISGNLASLIQKATHRIGSGKDSRRVPAGVKNQLDIRLADLSPGSTRLGVTFSTGECELVETVSSRAVDEIFSLLSAESDEVFMSKIAEIGSSSTSNLKNIVEECEVNNLNFDITWLGPFSNGLRRISLDSDSISRLTSKLSLTKIVNLPDESLSGELAVLSMYGKLEIASEGRKIKASYPINMLKDIQSKYKVGERVSLVASVTEVHNERVGSARRNYMIKSMK